MKDFQLRANSYEKVIEWIPFDKLNNIENIGKGGFGSVFLAFWLDGIRKIDGNRRMREPGIVALKSLSGSNENPLDFLKEVSGRFYKC